MEKNTTSYEVNHYDSDSKLNNLDGVLITEKSNLQDAF
jgi:hypothetical protein